VFLVEVSESPWSRWGLAEALDSVNAIGPLDFLDSPPTIRVERLPDKKWDILDLDSHTPSAANLTYS